MKNLHIFMLFIVATSMNASEVVAPQIVVDLEPNDLILLQHCDHLETYGPCEQQSTYKPKNPLLYDMTVYEELPTRFNQNNDGSTSFACSPKSPEQKAYYTFYLGDELPEEVMQSMTQKVRRTSHPIPIPKPREKSKVSLNAKTPQKDQKSHDNNSGLATNIKTQNNKRKAEQTPYISTRSIVTAYLRNKKAHH